MFDDRTANALSAWVTDIQVQGAEDVRLERRDGPGSAWRRVPGSAPIPVYLPDGDALEDPGWRDWLALRLPTESRAVADMDDWLAVEPAAIVEAVRADVGPSGEWRTVAWGQRTDGRRGRVGDALTLAVDPGASPPVVPSFETDATAPPAAVQITALTAAFRLIEDAHTMERCYAAELVHAERRVGEAARKAERAVVEAELQVATARSGWVSVVMQNGGGHFLQALGDLAAVARQTFERAVQRSNNPK